MANNNRPLFFFYFRQKLPILFIHNVFLGTYAIYIIVGSYPHIFVHTHQNMYHTHRPISIHLCILYTLLDIINKYCIHNKSACIYILLLLNGMAYLIYFFPMYMHFVSDACVIAQACNSYRIHRYI